MATIFRTVRLRITEVTSNYQMLLTDDIIVANASSEDLTVTLPSVVAAKGKLFRVKRFNDAGGNVIIIGIP